MHVLLTDGSNPFLEVSNGDYLGVCIVVIKYHDRKQLVSLQIYITVRAETQMEQEPGGRS